MIQLRFSVPALCHYAHITPTTRVAVIRPITFEVRHVSRPAIPPPRKAQLIVILVTARDVHLNANFEVRIALGIQICTWFFRSEQRFYSRLK